jgi:hypothetical protein
MSLLSDMERALDGDVQLLPPLYLSRSSVQSDDDYLAAAVATVSGQKYDLPTTPTQL